MNQRTLKSRYQWINIPHKSLPEKILKSENISTTSEGFNGSTNLKQILLSYQKKGHFDKCQAFILDLVECIIKQKSGKLKIKLNNEEMLFWLQKYFIINENQVIMLRRIYETSIICNQSLISVLYALHDFLNQDNWKEYSVQIQLMQNNLLSDIQSLLQ